MKKLILLFLLLGLFLNVEAQTISNTHVVDIKPSTDSIPVNILRFYIQFSKPMQEMDILKHIKLSNEEGKNITGVFFENQYELWNNERTEVTLIVDPGRVKLGLLANNKMGRAFDEGKRYTFTVDSLLLDFNDQKLDQSYTKSFIAVKEDRTPPNPKEWEVKIPKNKTKDPLFINFKDKIDHISAQTLLKVLHKNIEMKGKIILAENMQSIQFFPEKKWKKGEYQIVIHPNLEDISANSVNQTFDHKPSEYHKITDNQFINFNIK